jgi:3-deoxy-manno-octulosonate cytidylyltransferase (CMP-KDO synthetase)
LSDSQKVIAILPVRLESSRLPRKALKDICGLPMIVHVLKRCLLSKALDKVYVATDSQEVKEVVEKFGGEVIMTSSDHETGTDRIAEAALKLDADIVVNIQGDEALLNPEDVDKVVSELIDDPDLNVCILVNSFSKKNSHSDIKVVLNKYNDVMYLSRSDIPSDSRLSEPPMLKAYHIVPYRKDFLLKFSKWNKGILEKIEFNEYLRILENGERMRAVFVESDAVSVDTPDDLEYVRKEMPSDYWFQLYK